ncbi:MAG: AsmA family protein, partial [Bacteroidota bacterium]|nr:AsmA family protein [Bacteroidota bacterium]
MLAVPMALGAALATLAWVRGDAWKARALDTVNAQLEGDLLVDDIALSWWNGFPDMSVDLAQIAVTNAQNDTLIQAQRVGLELDVWSLLSETPDIHAITLEDGRLHLAQDVRGSWNVQALLRNADDAPDQTPTLSLAQVKLQNMALSVGLKEGLRASMLVRHGALELSPDLQSLAWSLELSQGLLDADALPKLRPLTVSTEGRVSQTEDGLWALLGEVKTGDTGFDLALTYKDEHDWQANIKAPRVTLRGIEQLLDTHPWKGQITLEHSVRLDIDLSPSQTQVAWSTDA